MRGRVLCLGLSLLFVGSGPVWADPVSAVSCPIGSPFTVAPTSADSRGNSASAAGGCFTRNGVDSLQQFFLGTDTFSGPGTLILNFAAPFTDGPGDDFALLTGTFWGPEAGPALVQFLRDGVIQFSNVLTLAANQLFTFDLPPGVSANQVWVTNISPDPPGVNDLASMSFIDAGATSGTAPVPEPATLVLLGTGLAATFVRRRKSGDGRA